MLYVWSLNPEMKKLKNWFIGDYISKTENVFEKARIELMYDYTLFFFILGLAFYGNLIAGGLWYHFYVVTFAMIALPSTLLILKYKHDLNMAGNWYVIQQTIVSFCSVYIEEARADMSGPLWTMSFIIFILFIFGIKKGFSKLIPFVSIFILVLVCDTLNMKLDFGIPDSQHLPNQPFVTIVPFTLCVYLIIVFLKTNNTAEKQIQKQKELVELKNREVTDSITYAKRLQRALMASERNIDQNIDRLKNNK